MNARFLPHVTVAAIAQRDGRFLFVEEKIGGETVINQPAGHLEEGESLVEAVRRETLEETGWRFRPGGLLGIYRFVAADGVTFLRFAFHGEAEEQVHDRPADPIILRALWLTPGEVLREKERLRNPIVLRCLEDHLAGHSAPLSLLREL